MGCEQPVFRKLRNNVLSICVMYNARDTFAEFSISHINKNCEIKDGSVGCGFFVAFDMCLFYCILVECFIFPLSF